nr:unnamed protein product [Digitaria exilis]
MAEVVLLPVVRGVVAKAGDVLVKRITGMWGIDGDRERLERRLVYVQSLLADAAVKSETNLAVKAWMKALKAAAYQADDILDDFQYEALRRESNQSMASKVLGNFTSKNRLVFRHKASRELKNVLEKIEELMSEMKEYELEPRAEVPQVLHRQTHSELDKSSQIFGRDDDMEVVVKLLLDQKDQDIVQVLPIIGMGGLGKTTLAKMVYNDSRVQKHFELKLWYCVSENFEANVVVRSVIELATNGRCDLPDNIELLKGRLQEVIGRKRFLLILDDVWNEDHRKWEEDLRSLLCSSIGASGSMIVVTSRLQQVASIMGTLPPYDLQILSEDASWNLFSMKAFSNQGAPEQTELLSIGKRIVSKCKGLPLALSTMGGLMSSKLKVQEWKDIAECNISDTSRGKDDVVAILKLSYKHLSSEMKQCFAFCAMFPKDYEMEKDKLIQLWMANGFILEERVMDLTDKGEGIIIGRNPSAASAEKFADTSLFLLAGDSAVARITGEMEIYTCKSLVVLPDAMDGFTSLEYLSIFWCPRIEEFPQGLLHRLPALKYLQILGCPELQRRCREGGEYFGSVSSIRKKDISFPATARFSSSSIAKFVKKLLPSC